MRSRIHTSMQAETRNSNEQLAHSFNCDQPALIAFPFMLAFFLSQVRNSQLFFAVIMSVKNEMQMYQQKQLHNDNEHTIEATIIATRLPISLPCVSNAK